MINIVWDFDGTIADTYPKIANFIHNELKNEKIHTDYLELLANIRKTLLGTIRQIVEEYKLSEKFIKNIQAGFNNLDYSDIKLEENVELIIKTVYNSGGYNFIFSHSDEKIISFLKNKNLLAYFKEIITSNKKFPRKPNPQAITYLLEKYNLNKESVIIIGDREIDIITAQNAGVSGFIYNKEKKVFPKEIKTINSFLDFYNIIRKS